MIRTILLACCMLLVCGKAVAEQFFRLPIFDKMVTQFVYDEDYTDSWHQLSNIEMSAMHWQQKVRVYINENVDVYVHNHHVLQSMWSDEPYEGREDMSYKVYPEGTLLVKENFLPAVNSELQPLTLTIMIKREPGYDPEFGDWQYIQSDTSGKVLLTGSSQTNVVRQNCISCHANVADRDHVYSISLSRQQTPSSVILKTD